MHRVVAGALHDALLSGGLRIWPGAAGDSQRPDPGLALEARRGQRPRPLLRCQIEPAADPLRPEVLDVTADGVTTVGYVERGRLHPTANRWAVDRSVLVALGRWLIHLA